MENIEFKKVRIKNGMCYYFDDNFLVYEKSHKNISSYENSYKTLIEAKPLRIWSNLLMELLTLMMEVHIWYFILCFEKYDDLTI